MQATRGRSVERRIDPEDGQARTFAELRKLCLGRYSDQEIEAYWEGTCRPVEEAAAGVRAAAAGAATAPSDLPKGPRDSLPAASSAAAAPRQGAQGPMQQAGERREAQARSEAWWSASGAQPSAAEAARGGPRERQQLWERQPPPAQMPLLAREVSGAPTAAAPANASPPAPSPGPPARAEEAASIAEVEVEAGAGAGAVAGAGAGAASAAVLGGLGPQLGPPQALGQEQGQPAAWGWPASPASQEQREVQDLLGEGAPDRKLSAKKIQVLTPWVIFALSLLSRALLRHCLRDLCVIFTAVASLSALAILLFGWFGNGKLRRSPVSPLALGVLCLLAAMLGAAVGEFAYERHWRQYWWLRTGRRFDGTEAATPAAARLDAAVLNFWEEGKNKTRGGTVVDHSRGAGFKEGHFYCVAPILSPSTAAAGSALVNYWAVGIDCCQHLGSFSCDDARQHDSGYGVVLLEAGYPCPGCNSARFRAAVDTAERMHGLVSATDALFVRWVRDPAPAFSSIFWQAVFFLVMSLLVAFVIFWLLGSLAWYYGIGSSQAAGLGNLWHSYRHKHIV